MSVKDAGSWVRWDKGNAAVNIRVEFPAKNNGANGLQQFAVAKMENGQTRYTPVPVAKKPAVIQIQEPKAPKAAPKAPKAPKEEKSMKKNGNGAKVFTFIKTREANGDGRAKYECKTADGELILAYLHGDRGSAFSIPAF